MKKIGRAWLSIVILALAIGCPFAYAQPAIAAEQPANIVFVDGAAVTLAPDSAGAFELETPVKNTGGAAGEPSFKLLGLDNAKCNKDNKDLILDPAIGSLDPNAVAIAHFTITGVPLPAVCYIELQTKGQGGNTSLKPVKLSQQYATATIADYLFWCRVAAGMTVVLTYFVAICWTLIRHRRMLSPLFVLGSPAWDFAKSWTSTLTLAGAILTAALALSALPELTRYASKAGYTILALSISFVVVVAPFIFNVFMWGAVEKGKSAEHNVVYKGWLLVLFISCAMTLFAGLAQLAVLFLLLDEIFRDYGFWSWSFQIYWTIVAVPDVTLLLAFALCVHALRSMLLTIQLQMADNGPKAAGPKVETPADTVAAAVAEAKKMESEAAAANVEARKAVTDFTTASEKAAKADDGNKATLRAEAAKAGIDANKALAVAETTAAKSVAAHRKMLPPEARTVFAEMVDRLDRQAPRKPPRSWPIL